VETEEQRAFLVREACEQMQGYLVGRSEAIERYLHMTGAAVDTAATARADAIAELPGILPIPLRFAPRLPNFVVQWSLSVGHRRSRKI
jgi:EAL domain-containing protein (putative c-di-GMP-specific phosphodiesterase class I)